ncbi:hypothetical protein NC652_037226 [Populus alba x Populus x berolinensis]|nr:hypothetical protein NC652_037226 [Populus alba x Populus x berolinensis]
MSEKVATHVHHSACMNQKHLLRFIKSKLRKEPDEVVIFRDGTYLNIERSSRLREIFLKQDNLIQGRFLEELTKQMVEYRISIYGRKQSEWDQIASWILPRLYNIYKEIGLLHHFRIFLIISSFRFSRSQLIQMSHPQLHVYLETGCWAGRCLMMKANLKDDPQSTCLHKINVPIFVSQKVMTTIKFRPHSGERMVAFLLYQIGLAMSPLSQQFLIFRTTIGILFQCFFQRGLNVSLSTDDAAPNSRLEVEFIVICVRLLEIQYTKFKFPTCFKDMERMRFNKFYLGKAVYP